MPKQRITKEMVVDAAFEIVRTGGIEQVMVKNIAEKIGCSVQPIYSYCTNMDGLRKEVTEKINNFIQSYVSARIDENDIFASTGKAYLQLAKDEPNFFKVFIMRQRNGIASLDNLYQAEANPKIAELISNKLNISVPQAKMLYLNMLIYTIGIGTIFSVTSPGISADEIYRQQETAYQTFLNYAVENSENKDTE